MLQESHRTRTVFRKVGGFVYVMSVLVSMEACFADPPKAPWNIGMCPKGNILNENSCFLLSKFRFCRVTIIRYCYFKIPCAMG